MLTYWIGPPPDKCDMCDSKIDELFVDGQIEKGPWGILCPTCFVMNGVGLGNGKGQVYHNQINTNMFVKIRG